MEYSQESHIVPGLGLRDRTHLASWFLPLVPPLFHACGIGFANFEEAYPTWRKPICVKGSVMKDECNYCRLLHLHIWRLIRVLHSDTTKHPWEMILILKIDWLQSKQLNRDETAKVHLIPALWNCQWHRESHANLTIAFLVGSDRNKSLQCQI